MRLTNRDRDRTFLESPNGEAYYRVHPLRMVGPILRGGRVRFTRVYLSVSRKPTVMRVLGAKKFIKK